MKLFLKLFILKNVFHKGLNTRVTRVKFMKMKIRLVAFFHARLLEINIMPDQKGLERNSYVRTLSTL